MRTPTNRRLLLPGLFAGLLLLLAPTARAEEGEEMDEVSKQVKAQMEKVLELMRQNEEALLEISTGAREKPRKVDVEVPDVPPGETGAGAGAQGAAGQGAGSGSTGTGASRGEEAARTLEEIIRGQRSASGQIPGELEELVRMVPQ